MVSRGVVLSTTIGVLLLATAGCFDAGLVHCGDILCPSGLACVPGRDACAPPDQIAACEGLADGAACTVAGVAGTCAGAVCVLPMCDGGSLDPGETCDGGAAPVPTCVDEGFDFGRSACSATCTTDIAACGSLRPVLARDVAVGEVVLGSAEKPMLWRGATGLAYISGALGGAPTLWARGAGDWVSYPLPATSMEPVLAGVVGAAEQFFVAAGPDVVAWDGAAFTALPPIPSGGAVVAMAAAEDVAVPLHAFAVGVSGWAVWRRDAADPEGWALVGTIPDDTDTPPKSHAATYNGRVYWPVQTQLHEVTALGIGPSTIGIPVGVSDLAAAPGRLYVAASGIWIVDAMGVRAVDSSTYLTARPCGDGYDAVHAITGQRYRRAGDGWAPLPVYGPSACNADGALVLAGNQGTEVRTYESGAWAAVDDPPVGVVADLVITPSGDVYAAAADVFAGRVGSLWQTLALPAGQSLHAIALGADDLLYGVGSRGVHVWDAGTGAWQTRWPGPGSSLERAWALADGLVVEAGPEPQLLVSGYDITYDPMDPGSSSFRAFLALPAGSSLRDVAGTVDAPVIAVREVVDAQYTVAIYEQIGGGWVGPIRSAPGSDGQVLDLGGTRFAALPDGRLLRWQAGASAAAIEDVLPLVPHAIGGTAADDVLVVGYATDGYSVAFHFDGTAWSPVRVPTIDGELQAVAVADGRIVLAGSTLYWLERILAGW